MTFSFNEWLSDQQNRDDRVGALARVPSMQDVKLLPSGRAADEHKIWADIVIRIVEPGFVGDFNDAWQEFLLARQAARDDLD